MSTRNCEYCNKQFEHIGYKRYCTYECGAKHKYEKQRNAKAELACTPRPCAFCKTVFTPIYGLNMRTKYCSQDCCSNDKTERFLEKCRAETLANPPAPRNCPHCNKEFVPYRNCKQERTFCSKECKKDFYSEELKRTTKEARDKVTRVCPICNTSFTPKVNLKEIYCTKKCGRSIGRRVYKMLSSCYEDTNTTKKDRSHKVLGYTPTQLLEHLQTFPDWELLNKQSWHLDHKFPIAAFVRKGIKDIALICCLENLQPLSGTENVIKNDNYDQTKFDKWLAEKKKKG